MRNPFAGHDIVAIAKTTFGEFRKDDLQGVAAEIAYHILFSVVPLLLFLTALTGFVSRQIGVDNVMDDVTGWLRDNLPDNTADAVVDPIEEVISSQSGGILSFGALTALWGGKNAMAALMKGLNVAFDAKEARSWWKKQLVAIGLTLALGGTIVLTSVIFVVGANGGQFLADLVGLDETWATFWSLLQWPLAVVLLMVALAAFYWAAPNVDAEFKWLTPGSVLAVVCWGIATVGLSYYFGNFAGYTAYGALGAVMAFIFWLYVMSLILLIGGELNAVVGRVTGTIAPKVPADYESRGAATGAQGTADEGKERPAAAGGRHGRPAPDHVAVVHRPIDRSRATLADGGDVPVGAGDTGTPERASDSGGRLKWRRIGSLVAAVGIAAVRLGLRARARETVAPAPRSPRPGSAVGEEAARSTPLSRADFARLEERTVGELRAAVEAGIVAKTELQLYGLDWSQLAGEPGDARLAEVFARHGAVVHAAPGHLRDGFPSSPA